MLCKILNVVLGSYYCQPRSVVDLARGDEYEGIVLGLAISVAPAE